MAQLEASRRRGQAPAVRKYIGDPDVLIDAHLAVLRLQGADDAIHELIRAHSQVAAPIGDAANPAKREGQQRPLGGQHVGLGPSRHGPRHRRKAKVQEAQMTPLIPVELLEHLLAERVDPLASATIFMNWEAVFSRKMVEKNQPSVRYTLGLAKAA